MTFKSTKNSDHCYQCNDARNQQGPPPHRHLRSFSYALGGRQELVPFHHEDGYGTRRSLRNSGDLLWNNMDNGGLFIHQLGITSRRRDTLLAVLEAAISLIDTEDDREEGFRLPEAGNWLAYGCIMESQERSTPNQGDEEGEEDDHLQEEEETRGQ